MPVHRISLFGAKQNRKGYSNKNGKWRSKPRINDDDLAVLRKITSITGVEVSYEADTNDLHFDIPTAGDKMEFSGAETGGQIIRLLVQLSILKAGGRTFDPTEVLEVKGDNKGCMLYVQMVLYLLKVNDSFTFIGGNPKNKSAPNPDYWFNVFVHIKVITGRSFVLTESNEIKGKFTIKRLPYVTPYTNWEQKGDEPWDIYLTDQILMAYFFTADAVDEGDDTHIALKSKMNKWDFHIPALIREESIGDHKDPTRKIPEGILRRFGFRIENVEDIEAQTQTITVRPPLKSIDSRGL
jgi:hypothetical protein